MRQFSLSHSPIKNIHFSKNTDDFVVKETPLYEFSGSGEHLVLLVRKKDITTWQMIQDISLFCGAKTRDFGYAGLKDKDGMTTQYVSIHKNYEEKLKNFTHDKIKILSSTYHNNKIKIGHLKGNNFFIRLKKVLGVDAKKLQEACEIIKKHGYPNYFGYQRFGKSGNNFIDGRLLLEGKTKTRNRKLQDFLISAYQSELFNRWLSKRVEISKYFTSFDVNEIKNITNMDKDIIKKTKKQHQFFKIFDGDILHHYPHGRAFVCEDSDVESERFINKEITVAGILMGDKTISTEGVAKTIEDDIYKDEIHLSAKLNGTRRFAWCFAENFEYRYKEEEAQFELSFFLQKGSYATVVLEEILGCYLDEL